MSNLVQFLRGVKKNYDANANPNGIFFATDTSSIFMNGKEYGHFPNEFKFINGGDISKEVVLCKDVNLNLQSYSVNTDIDFSNGDYLQIEIDLSKCSQDHNIELVSIGGDISTWSAFGHTLRFFYSHNKEYAGSNNLTVLHYTQPSSEGMTSEILSVGDTMTIKINSDGLYVNGTKRSIITKNTISDILGLTNLNIGSARTDDSSGRCDATYTKITKYTTLQSTDLYMSYKSNESTIELNELPVVTQEQNGVMSTADKIKLDSITGDIDCGEY